MKKKNVVIVFLLLIALSLSLIVYSKLTQKNNEISSANILYDDSFVNYLEENVVEDSLLNIPAIISEDEVLLKYIDSNNSVHLSKGDRVSILFEGDSSFTIDYNGIKGYVDKEKVSFYI